MFTIYMLCFCKVNALERTWTNAFGNNQWDNILNWSPVGIPGPQDSVDTFYGDNIIIPAGYTAAIKHIRLLGELTIETSAELNIEGGFMDIYGEVTNKGIISITNSPEHGIFHSTLQADDNPFVNEGEIFIENTVLEGLFIRYDQTFTNKANALIQIKNTGLESIDLQGVMANSGWITTRGSATQQSLIMDNVESAMTNFACGKLTFPSQIIFTDGLFQNFGFLETNYDGDHTIDGVDINNAKFIEDVHGAFTAGDFIQFGLYLNPYIGPRLKTGEPSVLFTGTIPLNANISDVFNDRMLTIAAGDFDAATLTWIPNNNAVGNTSFFMEVEDVDAGGCKDTIRFTISEPIQSVNYWLGGSGNWNFGIRWSYGTVPTATDTVAIYNTSDEVNIPLGIDAEVGQLFLDGTLTMGLNSSLSIDGKETDRGIIMQGGTLINRGELNLSRLLLGISMDTSTLENRGTINSLSNARGVELLGNNTAHSTFTNETAGEFISDSALAILIFQSDVINHGTFTLEADGDHQVITGDSLLNHGTINISGLGKNGGVALAGAVINHLAGSINISDIQYGLEGAMQNSGEIFVERCEKGVYNSREVRNRNGGKMNIRLCDTGIEVRLNKVFNEAGGEMEMVKNDIGITMLFNSQNIAMENRGSIMIDSTMSHGMLLEGIFSNLGQGSIRVSNTVGDGIFLDDDGEFLLGEASALELKKIQQNALNIKESQFVVEAGATMTIDSVGGAGILIDEEVTRDFSTITNHGEVSIGPLIQGNGIRNYSTFNNPGRLIIRNSGLEAYVGKEGSVFQCDGEFLLLQQEE